MKESTLQVEISGQATENITPDDAIQTLLLSSLEANIHRLPPNALKRLLDAADIEFELELDEYDFDPSLDAAGHLIGTWSFSVYYPGGSEYEGGYDDADDAETAALDFIFDRISDAVADGEMDIEKLWAAITNVEAK